MPPPAWKMSASIAASGVGTLSRHAGFRAYQRRTGVLLPWVGGQGWWPELLDEEQG